MKTFGFSKTNENQQAIKLADKKWFTRWTPVYDCWICLHINVFISLMTHIFGAKYLNLFLNTVAPCIKSLLFN